MMTLALLNCGGGGNASSADVPPIAGSAAVGYVDPQTPQPSGSAEFSSPVPPPSSHAAQDSVQVRFRFALGTTAIQSGLRRKQDASYSGGYTSPAFTPTISLTVTPLGGSAAGPYTGTCTSGASGNCTVSFTAAPGPTTFSGTISENGNVVSRFTQVQIVQPNIANTIAFTASPVVASVTLQLASASISAGTPQNVAFTVLAKDANGNTIAGTAPYVDVNGMPVSINLQVANSQSGGRGTASLRGPVRIASPAQGGWALGYDGNWLSSATVTASTTSTAVNMSGANASLTITPYITAISPMLPSGQYPNQIIAGRDGNLWFSAGDSIWKLTPAGALTTYSAGISASATVLGLANGADGNIWFVEYGTQKIGRITPTGSVTEFPGSTAYQAKQITPGPDGRLWFTEQLGNKIGAISLNGSVTEYSTIGTSPQGIIAGPDGAMWVDYSTAAVLGRFSLGGKETALGFSGATSGGYFSSIAVGADGNIWFIDPSSTAIGRYSFTTNAITLFTAGITPNAGIRNITIGPDGNIWFVEQSIDKIARITPAGTVTEYGAANGFAPGSSPGDLTIGPDGNLWVLERNLQVVGKFVL